MIHKLRYSKVITSANLLRIILTCDRCGKKKQFDITANQIMQYKDGQAKEADKWYFNCSNKREEI